MTVNTFTFRIRPSVLFGKRKFIFEFQPHTPAENENKQRMNYAQEELQMKKHD
jgi:hypothetical protein